MSDAKSSAWEEHPTCTPQEMEQCLADSPVGVDVDLVGTMAILVDEVKYLGGFYIEGIHANPRVADYDIYVRMYCPPIHYPFPPATTGEHYTIEKKKYQYW